MLTFRFYLVCYFALTLLAGYLTILFLLCKSVHFIYAGVYTFRWPKSIFNTMKSAHFYMNENMV